jgi:hypothetical protein
MLKNERHGHAIRAICSNNGTEFKTLDLNPFEVVDAKLAPRAKHTASRTKLA